MNQYTISIGHVVFINENYENLKISLEEIKH